MSIVELQPEDWVRYRALRLEALQRDPEAFGATYESAIEKPDTFWTTRLETSLADPDNSLLFAELEGDLVGMIGCFPNGDGAVKLISMYVRQSHRGCGIGQRLVEALIAKVPGRTIRLTVHETQGAAIRLYERCGFRTLRIDQRPPHRGDERELVMELSNHV